ncbi:hypothetical protein JYU34_017830 [Plutella xylostella]|uniref:Reverse transcriptase domain-containing protein n=1 Tax=Plutella xylostella TaxID=51655 RepID=A0ABQ7Q3G3_PLUXY|nr:hypothetical protein JYU34_017830 [Plutella xylostella]
MGSSFMDFQEETQYNRFVDTKLWTTHLNGTQNSLNIIHINIRSMRKNFNAFLILISQCQKKLDLIILTEINIKKEELPMYRMDDFDMYSNTREIKRGGGILIYAKKELNFSAFSHNGAASEIIQGQLNTMDQKDIHIVAVYRPPKTNKLKFTDELHNIIKKLPKYSDVIVVGDTNINLLDETSCRAKIKYKNMLYSQGMDCLINDVTREEIVNGRVTRSCLDHLWVRSRRPVPAAHLLTTKIADHYLIGATISISDDPILSDSAKSKCDKKVFLCNKLMRQNLDAVNWNELNDCKCPLLLYEKLCMTFGKIYENSKLQSTSKSKRLRPSWIDNKLNSKIYYRDQLFRKWKDNPKCMSLRLEYTKFRNKLNKSIQAAKNKFRQEELKKCNNDAKKVWSHINSWLGREKPKLDDVILKYLSGTDSLVNICNNFTGTFTEEIHNIKHNCNEKFLKRDKYVRPSNVSLRFRKASAAEIERIIDNMSNEKSPGSDAIRVQDIKYVKKDISPILANFINMSVRQGLYPDELKCALIRPIYKQGSHLDYGNYRPIAILSIVNKITEKIIVRQISNFLDKHNIISDCQHGFRQGRSTSTALKQFTDYVNNCLDERKQVVALFVDFKKAFDTLGHDQLLQAMEECGIRGPLNNWLKSYLSNRSMQTVISGTRGSEANIRYGVPTGSVYGPVGYIMHVNSLSNVIENCKMFMYADDTCLLYAHKDLQIIQKCIQKDLENIIKWSHDNGIIINMTKTKCMHICSPYNKPKLN